MPQDVDKAETQQHLMFLCGCYEHGRGTLQAQRPEPLGSTALRCELRWARECCELGSAEKMREVAGKAGVREAGGKGGKLRFEFGCGGQFSGAKRGLDSMANGVWVTMKDCTLSVSC